MLQSFHVAEHLANEIVLPSAFAYTQGTGSCDSSIYKEVLYGTKLHAGYLCLHWTQVSTGTQPGCTLAIGCQGPQLGARAPGCFSWSPPREASSDLSTRP